MARKPRNPFDFFDARRLVKGSRLSLGSLHARGTPAILIGVASIVFAAGLAEVLKSAAVAIPETLREARNLMLLTRGARELPSSN